MQGKDADRVRLFEDHFWYAWMKSCVRWSFKARGREDIAQTDWQLSKTSRIDLVGVLMAAQVDGHAAEGHGGGFVVDQTT